MLDRLNHLLRHLRSSKTANNRQSRKQRQLRFESLERRDLMTASPAAPTVSASSTETQINISWNAVPGATGYVVDGMGPNGWVQLGQYASPKTVSVPGLNANSTYDFDVAAYNASGTTWTGMLAIKTQFVVDHPAAAVPYAPVSGSLFGPNGPVFTDVHQGAEGDCWLMASLAEVAARNPQDIRNMFTYDGTAVEGGATVGVYTVRFYNSAGVANYVTVDTELPKNGSAYYYDQPQGGVLWAALAEKAYAQANGAGIVTSTYKGDSYSALYSGYGNWAMEAITGKPAKLYSGSNFAASVGSLFNGNYMLVLGSSTNANDNYVVGDSVAGTHAYAVIGYTASTGTFELYNPWGSTGLGGTVTYRNHQVYGGAFYASTAMVNADFANESYGAGAEFVNLGGLTPGEGSFFAPTSSSVEIAAAGVPCNQPTTGVANGSTPASNNAGATGAVLTAQQQRVAALDELFADWSDAGDHSSNWFHDPAAFQGALTA